MHKQYVLAILIVGIIFCCLDGQPVAATTGGVVISQVQTRSLNGGTAYEELVEVYNNSDIDVDITDWCVKYGSAGSAAATKTLSCFTHSNPMLGNYVFLPSRTSVLLVSTAFADKYPEFGYDINFSGGMSDSGRWLSLVDNLDTVIDMVEWGTPGVSTTAEGGAAASAPTSTQLIQRKSVEPAELQDTNNNSADFELSLARTVYSYGSIYEVEDVCMNIDGLQTNLPAGYEVNANRQCSLIVVDVCTNIDGQQAIMPAGYLLDDDGNCQPDVCLNLTGLQIIMPTGMEYDINNDCVYHDECANLTGNQAVMPPGYRRSDGSDCLLDLLPLKLTELLPNAVGSDTGNEFIELYNPNDVDVSLENYVFYVGANLTKYYNFPVGSHIAAGQYLSFSNDDINFTLVNSTSSLMLKSTDGQLIDETPVYSDPGDGLAWALIVGVWQYTNQPTPGAANLASEVVEPESNLQPCPAGQYRNPDTNRCRLIATTSSELAPCKDGQYRSEETNRCRNIASDVVALVPCAEGQERNPETNRCRSIATAVLGASDLTPCKEGQERNPETNRCRNIIAAMPLADYAPEQTYETSNNGIIYWSLAGVGFMAVLYGVLEWRREIVKLAYRLGMFLHIVK